MKSFLSNAAIFVLAVLTYTEANASSCVAGIKRSEAVLYNKTNPDNQMYTYIDTGIRISNSYVDKPGGALVTVKKCEVLNYGTGGRNPNCSCEVSFKVSNTFSIYGEVRAEEIDFIQSNCLKRISYDCP